LGLSIDGATLAAFEVPDGERKTDEFFGEVETYRQALVLTQGLPAGLTSPLQIALSYQGCADVGVCYPPQRKLLSVSLPAGAALPGAPALNLSSPTGINLGAGAVQDALPEDQAFRFEAIAQSADTVLARFVIAPGYYLYRDKTKFSASDGFAPQAPNWPASRPHRDEHFGEVQVYFDPIDVPLPIARTDTSARSMQLSAEYQGCKVDGICYPVMRRTLSVDMPAGAGAPASVAPAPSVESGNSLGLLSALLFALIGGLILNLMPCVLPILSLKAMSLAESGHGRDYAKRHALWYTAGVLASFSVVGLALIGLRASGAALGWGFQLQQPLLVGLLTYVMLALGLSLSGVFQIGASLSGVGQSLTESNDARGSFFTGVLACVVASPCTAPLMGAALTFALTQPPYYALLVFLALGLGLALPFLAIGFLPGLAARLPRPGAWMETFKQAMAFPMYLTAVWLLWVLGHQVGMDGAALVLVGAVALSMALWWWERQRFEGIAKRWVPAAILVACAAFPLGMAGDMRSAAQTSNGSEAYSRSRLDALLAEGKPVFVNMTADWCVTCKVNEKAVLSRTSIKTDMAERGITYLKGDWTNPDPAISAFLAEHGAVGVPLYVVYGKDRRAKVLPTVLTESTVRAALAEAAP
jgi:thiol:disulfide interchange protein DsbD